MSKKFSLDISRIGYFLVFKSVGGFFSNAIVKEQLSRGYPKNDAQYSHCEVSLGGQWSVNVVAPKIKVVDIRKKHKGRYVTIVRFRGEDYMRKRYKVAIWAATKNNLKYDWMGVARFKFSLLFHCANRFFCSELVLWALQREYFGAIGKAPEDTMPADILNVNFFEKMWSGVIE